MVVSPYLALLPSWLQQLGPNSARLLSSFSRLSSFGNRLYFFRSIRDFTADMAYCGTENFQAVQDAGGTGYIPFKSNATGGVGGLYEKMFHYFLFKREEFLSHYHKRSNVESTVSMIKRKFGDSIRSKSDVAMVNETLCKILCHNIVVLIHEMYELGIEPIFWADKAAQKQDDLHKNILKFRG